MLDSLASVGPGADPGVQAVSPQVTISHSPGGIGRHYFSPGLRLPSQPQSITTPRPVPSYCLVTEAHRCKQVTQGCYAAFAPSIGIEPTTC